MLQWQCPSLISGVLSPLLVTPQVTSLKKAISLILPECPQNENKNKMEKSMAMPAAVDTTGADSSAFPGVVGDWERLRLLLHILLFL